MTCRTLLQALLLAAVVGVWCTPTPSVADPLHDPMKFTLVENGEDRGTWIAAMGEITADTPAEFERFAKSVPKGLWIEFHSLGGLILPAMCLGRRIREGGFNTDVARTVFGGTGKSKLARGQCISSCAYAFLSGVRREVRAESILGFHQAFFKRQVDAKQKAEADRIMAGYTKDYLAIMGVATEVYSLALTKKAPEYFQATSEELLRLRIVTATPSADTGSDDGNDGDTKSVATQTAKIYCE